MRVEGIKQLEAKLKALSKKAEAEDVVVGYAGVNYALFVHEDLEARHASGKQAKFLEAPTKEMAPRLGTMVNEAMASGASFQQALLLVGLRLQRESQKIVPIDTSNLRASAFTARASEVDVK